MSTGIRQIEFLARAIVNRLEDRGLVEFSDAEVVIGVVTRVLEEAFREPGGEPEDDVGCAPR